MSNIANPTTQSKDCSNLGSNPLNIITCRWIVKVVGIAETRWIVKIVGIAGARSTKMIEVSLGINLPKLSQEHGLPRP